MISMVHQRIIEELGHLPLTQSLIHVMALPPDGRYMVAAALRLARLMAICPTAFPERLEQDGITAFSIQTWEHDVAAHLLSTRDTSGLHEPLYASPAQDLIAQKRISNSPLHGKWLTSNPGFGVLITARESSDVFATAFDRIVAITQGKIVQQHLYIEPETYLAYAQTCGEVYEYNRSRTKTKAAKAFPPLPDHRMNRMSRASRGIRTLQSVTHTANLFDYAKEISLIGELMDGLDDYRHSLPENAAGDRIAEHVEGLISFLADAEIRPRTKVKKDKFDTSGTDGDGDEPAVKGPRRPVEDIPWETLIDKLRLGTYLEAPDLLIPEDEPDFDQPEPTDDELAEARLYGMSPVEMIQPGPIVDLIDLNEQDEEATLEACSEDQADMKRRLAEHQPLSLDHVHPEVLVEVVDHLKEVLNQAIAASPPTANRNGIAALLLLCSIALGYSTNRLARELVIQDRVDDDILDRLPAKDNIRYDLAAGQFVVAVNQHVSEKILTASARPVALWIRVPDLIGLKPAMAWLKSLALPPDLIYAAAQQVKDELIGHYPVTLRQLWLALPLSLLKRTGEFSTGVLITGWSAENADVNLHYLSPRASVVIENYVEALTHMLTGTRFLLQGNRVLASQPGYIGAPQCPDDAVLSKLVEALAKVPLDAAQPFRMHNLIVLNTLLMASLAIGLRHAIDVQMGAMELPEFDLAYYREKGQLRMVVLPKRVGAQLRAYNRHLERLARLPELKIPTIAMDHVFFLLDADGMREEFHPSRIGEYLAEFGIEWPFEPNVLRRYLFTRLYEQRRWGTAIDHHIGHATEGRRPLTVLSGISLGSSLASISQSVDTILDELDWPVMETAIHES